MRRALTTQLVRRSESAAVRAGVTLDELMERAGAAVAAEASSLVPDGRVVVVAGKGNNGGDGWVAARCLLEAGRQVDVLSLAAPDTLSGPAAAAARVAVASGVAWRPITGPGDLVVALAGASLVIDAVFGVGLRDAPRSGFAEVLEAIDDAEAPVLAVDVPSGLDADTGAAPGAVVRADVTVTFGSLKAGLVLQPGASLAGEVVIADIGLPEDMEGVGVLELWDASDLAMLVPEPGPLDHKGSRGGVLVVGGAPGLTGAVCLAAGAALRSGAGYVTVAVPGVSMSVVECKLTAPVKVALPDGPHGELDEGAVTRVLELARRADAVVLGPGLGRSDATRAAARALARAIPVPLVLDADALWALGEDADSVRGRGAPVVLTPHAGEAAALLGVTREVVDADRPAAARALAGDGIVCVLKGPRTLVSDGERVVVTMSGGPGLATLGTGDVLAGMVGALLAAGLEPLEAAALAAHLHGAAGDAASRRLTTVCCTAEDVLTYLHEAVRDLLS